MVANADILFKITIRQVNKTNKSVILERQNGRRGAGALSDGHICILSVFRAYRRRNSGVTIFSVSPLNFVFVSADFAAAKFLEQKITIHIVDE